MQDVDFHIWPQCRQRLEVLTQLFLAAPGHVGDEKFAPLLALGVQEISEKTQAHLKTAAEVHRKEIEAQAQRFGTIYRRLSKLIVIGTIVILLSAFVAGAMAGARTWSYLKQQQAEEMQR